ncbi:hypothetical protein ABW19_dt0201907 [Dactylella cylindrospora]|nr:hypothetical protein ABW19_dt0201907 [Dactylella cylindrospora]
MAQTIIKLIGIIAGSVNIYNFYSTDAPSVDKERTRVRIGVGLNGGGLSHADGPMPYIRAYNDKGDYIGYNREFEDGSIASGSSYDDTISQEIRQAQGQKAKYLEIHASDDAICIAYVTATLPNGEHLGVVGDWWEVCGSDWYWSGIIKGGELVRCGWLDGDHTKGLKHAMVEVNLEAFTAGPGQDLNQDKTAWCPYIQFHTDSKYDQRVSEHRANHGGVVWDKRSLDPDFQNGTFVTESRLSKRYYGQGRNIDDNRLVIISGDYRAKEACNSRTSWGPDIMDDKYFCDMMTHTLWPLCTPKIREECFDYSAKIVRTKIGKRQQTNYAQLIDWRR